MSARVQSSSAPAVLLDELVRAQQQGLRNRQADRLGGLEIEHQFELGGLLDRKVRWLGPLRMLST